MKDFELATKKKFDERGFPTIEALLEVARRVNWDALHGPPYLRAGRFRPESFRRAAQQAAAAPVTSRRR